MSFEPHSLLPEGAQGLVFDCDGTLLDSMKQHYAAWRHTTKHFNIKMTAKEMVDLAGKPIQELLTIFSERSNVKLTPEEREEFFRMKSQFYLDHEEDPEVIEAVAEVVREAHKRGLPMAVASGGSREHVMRGLNSSGLIKYFKAVVTAEDVQHGKPAPDAFLKAAELIGVAPQYCVGYEDAALGMEAIRRAGFLAAIDVTVIPNYPHLQPDEEEEQEALAASPTTAQQVA